mgnify:CR=1 FL=1
MADPIGFNAAAERGLTSEQLSLLLTWMLPIQRSLGLEADRGFQNLQGRQQRFHAFLQQQLAAPPAVPFPQGVSERMSKLSSGFADYPERCCTGSRPWIRRLSEAFATCPMR